MRGVLSLLPATPTPRPSLVDVGTVAAGRGDWYVLGEIKN